MVEEVTDEAESRTVNTVTPIFNDALTPTRLLSKTPASITVNKDNVNKAFRVSVKVADGDDNEAECKYEYFVKGWVLFLLGVIHLLFY